MMKKIALAAIMVILASCNSHEKKSDAFGNFEATEILVSSEASGKLLFFNINEGAEIDSGRIVAHIDSVQYQLKFEQIRAQKEAVRVKSANIVAQIDLLNQQKTNLQIDKSRIESLLKNNAATQKQLDDISGAMKVIEKQVQTVEVQNPAIFNEIRSIDAQIGQMQDLLKKCNIINPMKGTVLNKFAENSELCAAGKPLYKIADLSTMYLRAYISGGELPKVKLGQKAMVLVDKDASSFHKIEGIVTWISSKAEFTPKIIQTKDERVNMVYAVKIAVKNDGTIKIGMPGEVEFGL
ncbi:MAG: HlyD family efflux transporter periplasmic adaptor subunit [Candidatus Kapabacteria bacterium]|nr:HlyD family efflux transporter periplasmic adaptor subunit [Candidatus Kapabacteria bacterium]